MKKPEVNLAIEDLLELAGTGRSFRVQKLGEHMRHPDPVISLKALDMGFKLSGDEETAKRKTSEKSVYVEVDMSVYRD